MSFIKTTRCLFILIVGVFGFALAERYGESFHNSIIFGLAGIVAATGLVLVECLIKSAHPKTLLVGLVGLTAGLLTANMIATTIPPEFFRDNEMTRSGVHLGLHLMFGYLGLVLSLRYVDRIDIRHPFWIRSDETHLEGGKVLDTSALIDGRIADVATTHFLEGVLVIPHFVLGELHYIADSPDAFRRQRGRRGLDAVRRMQAECKNLEITDRDYPGLEKVDDKLVELAKSINGKIITTDYNLNKVAAIHYIDVLNVNDLANALKPVVLPGEEISVALIKEGKDDHQGVGYLEDGTMVVVDQGYSFIGQTVRTRVTSILQTPAGRMVFAKQVD